MFVAGASGYLLKDCAFEEVVEAVRAVLGGKTYISPEIAGTLIGDYVTGEPERQSPTNVLSNREREIVQLIAEGRSTKEIAACLKVSTKTVETHRANILAKLNLRSIPELTSASVIIPIDFCASLPPCEYDINIADTI
jgi:DNA-binding NarL/FixJ family response regulator